MPYLLRRLLRVCRKEETPSKEEEMSPALVVPVAQGLYLCDGHLGFPGVADTTILLR